MGWGDEWREGVECREVGRWLVGSCCVRGFFLRACLRAAVGLGSGRRTVARVCKFYAAATLLQSPDPHAVTARVCPGNTERKGKTLNRY